MAGKTINTTITKPITIGSGGYNSPLTITSTGTIAPASNYYGVNGITVPASAAAISITNHGAVYGGYADGSSSNGYTGGNGIEIDSTTSLTNSGVIAGGTGGFANYNGGAGGIGVDVQATSSIGNSGQIFGGAGGYGETASGVGGVGVDLAVASTLNNSGTITGGASGNSGYAENYRYAGGLGVYGQRESVVINSGRIVGGAGGTSGTGSDQNGNYSGAGLQLYHGGSLTNSGTIIGGGAIGSTSQIRGSKGGDGAYLLSSTATNTGLIQGGAGSIGQLAGAGGAGAAIYDYGVLTNKGRVTGGVGGVGINGSSYRGHGGQGGVALGITSYAIATNNGQLTGGTGGLAGGIYVYAGSGGAGVLDTGGKLTNNATISGGGGGSADGGNDVSDTQFGGNGGAGISSGLPLFVGAYSNSIINYGVVRGGAGGYNLSYGSAGQGGAGVSLNDASLSNHGTIIGGAGGNGYGDSYGGIGGAGIKIGTGAKASNTGNIIGGAGGYGYRLYAQGGAGVFITGGTFVDSGVVRAGNNTDAVYLAGAIAGTLVLDPGASFSGAVFATGNTGNVLELAGSSSSVLAGIGTEFTGFSQISFVSGATRSIEGNIGAFGTIDGFATHDTVIIDGFTDDFNQTMFFGPDLYLYDGGYHEIYIPHTLAKDLIITDAGGKTTIAAASGSTAHTIGGTAEQFVFSGATASNSKILAGGVESIYSDGTAAHTTIGGGELLLQIGGKISSGVTFNSTKGGDLVIDSATMPTATISGFIAGDTITLAGVTYNANDKVTVVTAGTVTIEAPGINYKLDIAGATAGETDFKFGAGSVLTRTTAMQPLTFISAAIAPNTASSADDVFRSIELHHLQLAHYSISSHWPEPASPSLAGILASNLAHAVISGPALIFHHGGFA